ncbi:MAG: hypothetical protein CMG91_11360 [Marinobacter sp.]|nr:hypothetical protein [Marinobacter sp.]|tara:strand:- start:1529 stop:3304 length:1776 start_codon:yes stop_codon:yes gene_type:complete
MFIFFVIASLSFLFPVGLYPFQDLTRDFLAGVSIVALLMVAIFKNDKVAYVPKISLLLIPLVAIFIVYFLSNDGPQYSYYLYSISFVLAFFVLVSGAGLANYYGREKLILGFSYSVLTISVLAVLVGLARYYGILKFLIPWISVDGNRLIGPFGQPNLMGLLILSGISSLWYLVYLKEKVSFRLSIFLFLILFYAASLTASRAFLINFFLLTCLCCFYVFRLRYFVVKSNDSVVTPPLRSIFILVALGVFSISIVPRIDAIISAPLIESGFVNRIDPDITADRMKSLSSSGRLDEWGKVFSGVYPDSVVFGNGLGRYGDFSNRAELESGPQGNGSIWNHAHNIFIMFYVEWGVVGIFAVLIPLAYVLNLIYRSKIGFYNLNEFFPISVLVFFLFHSLVEFSLWYLPFLGIFLFSIASIDKCYEFVWSSRTVPRTILFLILLIMSPLALYIANDAVKTIKIMYKDSVDLDELWALDDLSRNRIIGYGPMLVMAARFPALEAGGDRALKRFEELSEWRPYPLFRVRVSVLSTVFKSYEESCKYIEETVTLYPDSVAAIQNGIIELYSLEDQGELTDFSDCILRGVSNWVAPER